MGGFSLKYMALIKIADTKTEEEKPKPDEKELPE